MSQSPKADVLVTIEGGVADITVLTPGIVVDLRDFDVQDEDDPSVVRLHYDGESHLCFRSFVGYDETAAKTAIVNPKETDPDSE